MNLKVDEIIINVGPLTPTPSLCNGTENCTLKSTVKVASHRELLFTLTCTLTISPNTKCENAPLVQPDSYKICVLTFKR